MKGVGTSYLTLESSPVVIGLMDCDNIHLNSRCYGHLHRDANLEKIEIY